jgi:GNAT superfamily N-acetyltransferase
LNSYTIRQARSEEQPELTRLAVRATLHSGYDGAFIDRAMPGLTITLPLITGGCVQVAEQKSGETVGLVAGTTTTLQGIALLYSIFVDPLHWKCGVGRALFGAAVTRAKALNAGALMIYAAPTAEGFYKRMGAIRIGEGPFYFSPEVTLSHLLFIAPPACENSN